MAAPSLTLEAFADDTFDVDHFVASARKHLPLSSLQVQLREQVQQVQTAVVELINKDYQDFVALSSNLVPRSCFHYSCATLLMSCCLRLALTMLCNSYSHL